MRTCPWVLASLITNTGDGDLTFLCTCSPPWAAEDTYFD